MAPVAPPVPTPTIDAEHCVRSVPTSISSLLKSQVSVRLAVAQTGVDDPGPVAQTGVDDPGPVAQTGADDPGPVAQTGVGDPGRLGSRRTASPRRCWWRRADSAAGTSVSNPGWCRRRCFIPPPRSRVRHGGNERGPPWASIPPGDDYRGVPVRRSPPPSQTSQTPWAVSHRLSTPTTPPPTTTGVQSWRGRQAPPRVCGGQWAAAAAGRPPAEQLIGPAGWQSARVSVPEREGRVASHGDTERACTAAAECEGRHGVVERGHEPQHRL